MNIPSNQWVEMRVVFPRRLLTSTAGAKVVEGNGLAKIVKKEVGDAAAYQRDRDRLEDAKRHAGRTLLYLLLIGIGPAILVMLLVWLVYGRERKTGYDREYEQAPPDDIEPALIPPLLRQDKAAGSNEFTATLFDLIRRGRYKSTPVNTEKKTWGGLKHETVADLLLTKGDESVELAQWEEPVAEVIDSVVDADGERLSEFREKITANRTTNAARFSTFKSRVSTSIEQAQVVRRLRRRRARARADRADRARGRPALDRRSRAGARARLAGATSCWPRSACARS